MVDRFVVKLQAHERMMKQRRAFYTHMRTRVQQLLASDDLRKLKSVMMILKGKPLFAGPLVQLTEHMADTLNGSARQLLTASSRSQRMVEYLTSGARVGAKEATAALAAKGEDGPRVKPESFVKKVPA